jgi:hypothetical protein
MSQRTLLETLMHRAYRSLSGLVPIAFIVHLLV